MLTCIKPFRDDTFREDQTTCGKVNGSFRDTKATVFDAARFAKGRAKGDIIEIVDRSTGQKLVMLEDGRTG